MILKASINLVINVISLRYFPVDYFYVCMGVLQRNVGCSVSKSGSGTCCAFQLCIGQLNDESLDSITTIEICVMLSEPYYWLE